MQRTEARECLGTEVEGDLRLTERAKVDPEAFAALYDRHVDAVYRYAVRRTTDHADAEDVTAQTFRRALEGIGRFEPREVPFAAWLFRIAHNALIDRYRASRRTVSLDGLSEQGFEAEDARQPSPVEAAEQSEATGRAWAAVATLPATQRRAVVLRFGRDLSHAQVGVLIRRSEPATKQLIFRAMLTLRARLAGQAEVE